MAYNHLTEEELRRLHKRHPSVAPLQRLLEESGHDDVKSKIIEKIVKFCKHCQLHSRAPGRFKFKITDEENMLFNKTVEIDIAKIGDSNVLHVIDLATGFNAARYLPDDSAASVWNAFRMCWIDVLIGPPEYVRVDAGTNVASAEFAANASSLNIAVQQVPVEAHNSIGKIERSHGILRRVFVIIKEELKESGAKFDRNLVLQMACKAINDTAGPDKKIPTLLVFGAYPRLVEKSSPTPDIMKRAKAIDKAMEELRKLYVTRKVRDALAMRNGPNVAAMLALPLNSQIRVWREHGNGHQRGAWKGPFTLVSRDGYDCLIDNGGPKPVKFHIAALHHGMTPKTSREVTMFWKSPLLRKRSRFPWPNSKTTLPPEAEADPKDRPISPKSRSNSAKDYEIVII